MLFIALSSVDEVQGLIFSWIAELGLVEPLPHKIPPDLIRSSHIGQRGTLFSSSEEVCGMEIAPRITVDEKVQSGKPVVQGTRVPVDLVLGKLASGMTYDEVIQEYELAMEDIYAVLDYAAKHLSNEEVRAVG
jgi:uncharacterized protein (DUF433 family)